MRIAIIGSGIAGLTCGWSLKQASDQAEPCHVTIFESQPTLGMDAHSIDLPTTSVEGGTDQARIDVPPRMFNREEWVLLSQLYETLGVATENVDASKSFADSAGVSWLQLGDRYGKQLSAMSLLSGKVRSVAADALRMQQEVTVESLSAMADDQTLAEHLSDGGYSTAFVNHFLYAGLSATVLTCSYAALKNYPAKIALRSLRNQVDQSPLNRTCFGTVDVVNRLSREIDDVRLGAAVTEVVQIGDQVQIALGDGTTERFDHLVIATQANSAVRLLGDDAVFQREREILRQFEYEHVEVVVHTDESFMPAEASHRACFNFFSNAAGTESMCTMWMNRFYPERSFVGNVYQTIRPFRAPTPEHVIAVAAMQRPIVNVQTLRAVSQLLALPTERRHVWFCGSYAAAAVPLLESGVVSAKQVVAEIEKIRTRQKPRT